MATITLDDIKKKYLPKFFIENGTENKLPLNFDNVTMREAADADPKIAHAEFVNLLLQMGLPNLQISYFKSLMEDVSIALKIKKALKSDENDADREQHALELDEIRKEIEIFTTMVKRGMSIYNVKFEGPNEASFILFLDDWYRTCQNYYHRLGKTSYPTLPAYEDLMKCFLCAYLDSVCSFHIYLYEQAVQMAKNERTRSLVDSQNQEDDLFYMETHNFFMKVLNMAASLNFNYLNIEDEANIYDIDYIAKLLRLLSRIFEGCLSVSEIKEFYDLVDSGNLVALPIDSYYRKWLYSKANELQESISR